MQYRYTNNNIKVLRAIHRVWLLEHRDNHEQDQESPPAEEWKHWRIIWRGQLRQC